MSSCICIYDTHPFCANYSWRLHPYPGGDKKIFSVFLSALCLHVAQTHVRGSLPPPHSEGADEDWIRFCRFFWEWPRVEAPPTLHSRPARHGLLLILQLSISPFWCCAECEMLHCTGRRFGRSGLLFLVSWWRVSSWGRRNCANPWQQIKAVTPTPTTTTSVRMVQNIQQNQT